MMKNKTEIISINRIPYEQCGIAFKKILNIEFKEEMLLVSQPLDIKGGL